MKISFQPTTTTNSVIPRNTSNSKLSRWRKIPTVTSATTYFQHFPKKKRLNRHRVMTFPTIFPRRSPLCQRTLKLWSRCHRRPQSKSRKLLMISRLNPRHNQTPTFFYFILSFIIDSSTFRCPQAPHFFYFKLFELLRKQ